jgi:hypothetical protein
VHGRPSWAPAPSRRAPHPGAAWAAAWAATHRVLLAIVAVTVAVAAAVTLTVLLGDSGTTTSPATDSDWDRSGCGGVMTVTFLRPTC